MSERVVKRLRKMMDADPKFQKAIRDHIRKRCPDEKVRARLLNAGFKPAEVKQYFRDLKRIEEAED